MNPRLAAFVDPGGFLKIVNWRSQNDIERFANPTTVRDHARSVEVDPERFPDVGSNNGHPIVDSEKFIFRENQQGEFVEKHGKPVPPVLTELYKVAKDAFLANPCEDDDPLWAR